MAVYRGSRGGSSRGGSDVYISAEGLKELQLLSKRFKTAGDEGKKFRSELRKEINRATKPLKQAAKARARATLPKRGGLASLVARSRFTTKQTLTGRNVGVRITASRKNTAENLRGIDGGRLRHPLFGNGEHWFQQRVLSGWFTKPMQKGAKKVRSEIVKLVQRTAKQLGK